MSTILETSAVVHTSTDSSDVDNAIDQFNDRIVAIMSANPKLTRSQAESMFNSEVDPSEPTPAERKAIDGYASEEENVVTLAIATLDPKDMLRKYAKLGAAVRKLGSRRKASVKCWNGAKDWAKVCTDLETLVRMRVAIKEVRMDVYARVDLFLDAIRPTCPTVDKLSYYQIANKFLPTLAFDASDLTGEIRKEWLTWIRQTIDKQVSDTPYTMAELDASIKDRKAEIDNERKANDKRTPEQIDKAEQKAANQKIVKARESAQSKIANAISESLTDGTANANDIDRIFHDMATLAGVSVPTTGFDASNCTKNDCIALAQQMLGFGKLAEMVTLRDTLNVMIMSAQNAMATVKAAG